MRRLPRSHSWGMVILGLRRASWLQEALFASLPLAGMGRGRCVVGTASAPGQGQEMWLLSAFCHLHAWPSEAGPRPEGLSHTESHWTRGCESHTPASGSKRPSRHARAKAEEKVGLWISGQLMHLKILCLTIGKPKPICVGHCRKK